METYRKYYVPFILMLFFGMALHHVGQSELFYWGGDESRHLMNGVFIKDCLTDGGWRHPFDYARWYYLKYPALSLHQYPPLFYILEAVVFFVCGINVTAMRLVICLILAAAIWRWYRYVSAKYDPEVALFSSLIFLTMPLFLNNYHRIMLDSTALAVTLFLLPAIASWQRVRRRTSLYLIFTLFCVILLISITSYFLLFYILLVIYYQSLSEKAGFSAWKALGAFFFVLFALFFLFGTISESTAIPLFYRTLQGVNMMSVQKVRYLIHHLTLSNFWRFRWIEAFGMLWLILPIIGVLFAARKREWNALSNELLYAANFVFIFTVCMTHFEHLRFNLFLLPVIAILSGYAIANLLRLPRGKISTIGMAVVVALIVINGLRYQPAYLRGYERAAQELAALNTENAPVLCDAFLDGNFIAYVRKYDPLKRQMIFRGDKTLFVSTIYYKYIQKTYVETEANIYRLLNVYGIKYVVADEIILNIKAKVLLRNALRNPAHFRRLATYPVTTNLDYWQATLHVYEYLQATADDQQPLSIEMPVMSMKYTFTIDELRRWTPE